MEDIVYGRSLRVLIRRSYYINPQKYKRFSDTYIKVLWEEVKKLLKYNLYYYYCIDVFKQRWWFYNSLCPLFVCFFVSMFLYLCDSLYVCLFVGCLLSFCRRLMDSLSMFNKDWCWGIIFERNFQNANIWL